MKRCEAIGRLDHWPYACRCRGTATHYDVRVPVGEVNPGVNPAIREGRSFDRLDLCDEHNAMVPL